MSNAPGPPPPDASQTSFETAIARLGQIVEALERGDLPLEQSLLLFEEGVRLARASQGKLDQAERRLEELLSVSASGEAVTRPLPSSTT